MLQVVLYLKVWIVIAHNSTRFVHVDKNKTKDETNESLLDESIESKSFE